MPKLDKNLPIKIKKVKKTKPSKTKTALLKPRSVHSKENTLKYFECLLHQVANNERVKITRMCRWCRGNKDKVAWSQAENKKELVKKVAKGYLEFGKGLGHLLHADIVGCSCKK